MPAPLCAVVGVGPGNGASIARLFAREGYRVALMARGAATRDALAQEIDGAASIGCDVTDPASITAAFATLRAGLGEPDVVIYNAGSGQFGDVTDVSRQDFEQAWRTNAAGAFDVAQAVLPAMRKAGQGAFIVIGATASLRGGIRSAAFAPAKAAQRALAQSMARRLWPEGIHVALVIVDGVIDLERTRARLPDKPDDFFLQPDAIAQSVLALVRQPRSAWSFEIDVRPFRETW